MTNLFNYGYDHSAIREFVAHEANGIIVEQALLATKNLESALYKRKSITSTEWKAVCMLIQCTEELYNHAAEKPIDDTRSMLPRELRDGLRREVVEAVIAKNPDRFTSTEYNGIRDAKERVWMFDGKDVLYRVY